MRRCPGTSPGVALPDECSGFRSALRESRPRPAKKSAGIKLMPGCGGDTRSDQRLDPVCIRDIGIADRLQSSNQSVAVKDQHSFTSLYLIEVTTEVAFCFTHVDSLHMTNMVIP